LYDIIFDFSSSPVRGGLRRLVAYLEYFSVSSIRALFLVNPNAGIDREKYNVEIEAITQSVAKNALLCSDYLEKYRGKTRWFFSYGIPIARPIGKFNWLHISNVLPFSLGQCSLEIELFFKMIIRSAQYSLYSKKADMVSAESKNSILLYKRSTGYCGPTSVLYNSTLSVPKDAKTEKGDYAIALGTTKYKRIDSTYDVFRAYGAEMGIHELWIVGNARKVGRSARSDPRVRIIDFIPEVELVSILSRALYFISTAEVENSSTAALEGLLITKRAILSMIPPVLEMIDVTQAMNLICKGREYIVINEESQVKDIAYIPWRQGIEEMLTKMQLPII